MRLVWCCLLFALAPLSAAPLVVLRGDALAAEKPALRAEVAAYAQRVVAALAAVGAEATIASDTALPDALVGATLAILPYNKLSDEQVAELAAFVARGGRLVACFTTGSDRLPELLGVRRGGLIQPAYPGQLESITFTAAARETYPGLPPEMQQDSWHAFDLTPLPGTAVLGIWGDPDRASRPAVTGNGAGLYLGHVLMPGDLAAKGLFLIGYAAKTDPRLWEPVLAASRRRAIEAAGAATERWQRLKNRADVSDRRFARLGEQALALGVRAATLPPPAGGRAAQTLLAMYRQVEREARELRSRLYPSPAEELRGLWVFASRPIDWPKLVSQAKNAGLNAIFYRVSRGGSAVYPSAILPRESWASERDELREGLEVCHRYGLELHAWRVDYHLGSAPESFVEQMRQAGRLGRDLSGREALFLNPGDPRNEAHELAAIRELLGYDVDGIHLDYIRYPDQPSYDFDYSNVSREQFSAQLGRPLADWPEVVVRGELKQAYEDWLRENINRLVRRAAAEIEATRPEVCFSAAVWRNDRTYRYAIKQDWPHWLAQGWLDLVVPMDYTTDPSDLRGQLDRQVALAGGETRVAAGLGAWLLNQPEDLLQQVEIARDAGADGFVLFSSNAADLDDQLAALALGATATPARPTTAAPPARWRLPEAIPRRGAAPVLAAGYTAAVEVLLGPGFGTLRETIGGLSGQLRLVRPETGEVLHSFGKFVSITGPRAQTSGRFPVPEGRFQLSAVGQGTRVDGRPIPFEVRGPVLLGWTAEELAELRDQLAPPEVVKDGAAIGVWHDGLGSDAILAALEARKDIIGVPVHQLRPDHLAPLRYFVLPQMGDVRDLYYGGVTVLRDWVQQGGTLLLTHDAVGYRWHPVSFPEFGWGESRTAARGVTAVRAFGDLTAGWQLKHAYGDHLALRVRPDGRVLMTEPDGQTPVVAEGRIGRGRVILDGMLTGATGGASVMPPRELDLLLALLGVDE